MTAEQPATAQPPAVPSASGRPAAPAIEHLGFAPHYVEYHHAWAHQRAIHAEVVAGTRPNTTLLLEHQPVFTAGTRTARTERPTEPSPLPVIDVDRGGKITWHGPGQLIGYPIWRLPTPIDVVAHVRTLEDILLRVTATLGVPSIRIPGRSGVWIRTTGQPDRKIAAIGVRVAQGVTMHGFALNCNCDLTWSQVIIPCGLEDAEVTTLSQELHRNVRVTEVLPLVEAELNRLRLPPATAPRNSPPPTYPAKIGPNASTPNGGNLSPAPNS